MPPKSMLAENDMWDTYIIPYVVSIDELGHVDGEQDAVEGVAGGGHAGKESCRGRASPRAPGAATAAAPSTYNRT